MKPIKNRPNRLYARDLTELAFCTALLFGVQIALAALPNIELVTLLVMLYTRWFGKKALFIVYLFALLEGIFYGFHLWWISYLYVWSVLWLLVMLLQQRPRALSFWAALGGGFGLMFGFLCAFPYLALGGIQVALGWWIAGIPFDLIHAISNFLLILVLFRPLEALYVKVRSR